MNGLLRQSTANKPIKVGIFGRTKAGKTRFLYQLLTEWERQGRIDQLSDEASDFLSRVRREIELYGDSQPTSAAMRNIQVTVALDAKTPHQTFNFHDLRGELLDKDPRDEPIHPTSPLGAQVHECDAFLFFFDPACLENRDAIDARHAEELQRAEQFIDHVLAHRENHYLPIVFALTHHDRWHKTPLICKKADQWKEQVFQKLISRYENVLRGHYPKELVCKDRIFHNVSSVDERPQNSVPPTAVIEQLYKLVKVARQHHTKRKWRILQIIGVF